MLDVGTAMKKERTKARAAKETTNVKAAPAPSTSLDHKAKTTKGVQADDAAARTNLRCDVCLEAVFEEYDDAVAHESKCTNGKSKKKKAKKGGEGMEGQPPTLPDENGWYSRTIYHHLSPHYIYRKQKGGMGSIQQLKELGEDGEEGAA